MKTCLLFAARAKKNNQTDRERMIWPAIQHVAEKPHGAGTATRIDCR